MKIVDYQTFVNLPEGTVYCETEPCIFGELKIKEDTINEGNDWYYIDFHGYPDTLDFTKAYNSMEAGEDVEWDFSSERDGMYDQDRKFAIYSESDVNKLIQSLKKYRNENTIPTKEK
jgi:hypothetical protein